MCSRYTVNRDHVLAVAAELHAALADAEATRTRFNIAPNTSIPAILPAAASATSSSSPPSPAQSSPPTVNEIASDTSLALTRLRWGLVPAWSRDDRSPLINARAETLTAKPSFRDAFQHRRCLVPASGFIEWETIGRAKQPWLFHLPDDAPFCFAGIWETWREPDGGERHTCALVTTTPNALLARIHDRMPVVLADADSWRAWLAPCIQPTTTSAQPGPSPAALLAPIPADRLRATALSTYINNPRHDGPACLAPAPETQLGLDF